MAVNGSQSYAPYGEVFGASGTMDSPFAFTGEPLDGNGLQYHRARYYMPSSGVWASLDPLETANRYGYVDGNVINMVDPSGNLPTIADIEDNTARYSCRCGWLDTKHIGAYDKANATLQALKQPIAWHNIALDVVEGLRVVALSRRAIPGVPDLLGTAYLFAKVYDEFLYSPSQIEDIALSIYMTFEHRFESLQSTGNSLGLLTELILGKRPSGFAEEDLVSDLLGFWLAKKRCRKVW